MQSSRSIPPPLHPRNLPVHRVHAVAGVADLGDDAVGLEALQGVGGVAVRQGREASGRQGLGDVGDLHHFLGTGREVGQHRLDAGAGRAAVLDQAGVDGGGQAGAERAGLGRVEAGDRGLERRAEAAAGVFEPAEPAAHFALLLADGIELGEQQADGFRHPPWGGVGHGVSSG